MSESKGKFKTIDEYIAQFPKNVRDVLEDLRETIKESAPEAEETISYAMPAFKLNGKALVYFAAWKNHIGFYPAGTLESFKKEQITFQKQLSQYKQTKGTVQFPLNKRIPLDLVKKIVKFRATENLLRKR